MSIKLKNNTKSVSKLGYCVSIDPNDPYSFIYSPPSSTKVIGIITEQVPYRSLCTIATQGEKAMVYVNGNVVKGNSIRLSKTTDRTSLGTSMIAKVGDSPYLKIGDALSNGRGLIPCLLELQHQGTDDSGYVPYAGATDDVDLGTNGLTANDLTIGGATNNITINGSGEMVFNGDATVWDDLPPVPIIAARLGSSAPTLATFIGDIEQYTFDATNDFVIGATEIIHAWKEGTIIYPHIHWSTNGLEGVAKGVQWQLKYTIGDDNEAFSGQVTVAVDTAIPAGTADRTHLISEFAPTIAGTNYEIGTYIIWRLDRIATAKPGGAPAANPFALAIGFHVEMDTVGSKTRLSK